MEENAISKKNAYLIITITLSFIGGSLILNIPLYVGLFLSAIFSVLIFMKQDYSLNGLIKIIINGVRECSSVYIIVILIGGLVSIWIASGTVPTIMYYGFNYLKGSNFLLACFLISIVVSVVMGTAIGTISTIGIAFLGIGKGLLIPTPLLLGAIISGAFIADKISPIASLVNITMKTIDMKYNEYLKYLMKTQIPLIVIGSIIYYQLGKKYVSEINPLKLQQYQTGILDNFYISIILLLLPLIVIGLAVLGLRIVSIMSFGLAGGVAASFFLQKIPFSRIIHIVLFGYKGITGVEELDSILRGGGMIPMLEVVLVIAGAIALSSLFEGTNMIKPLVSQFTDGVKSKGKLVFRTSILSNVLTITTCDQTVGILLLGRMLKKKFNDVGLNRFILARTITDSGTTIAPIIPWNSNSIIIVGITGISTLEYAPFAVLCYLSPLITIAFGYGAKFFSKENGKEGIA